MRTDALCATQSSFKCLRRQAHDGACSAMHSKCVTTYCTRYVFRLLYRYHGVDYQVLYPHVHYLHVRTRLFGHTATLLQKLHYGVISNSVKYNNFKLFVSKNAGAVVQNALSRDLINAYQWHRPSNFIILLIVLFRILGNHSSGG